MIMARHAGRLEVGVLVACGATHGDAPAIAAALDRRLMQPARVGLSGRSPAGWQLTQRAEVITLPASVNRAADRAADR
jgi:hypothetical protein